MPYGEVKLRTKPLVIFLLQTSSSSCNENSEMVRTSKTIGYVCNHSICFQSSTLSVIAYSFLEIFITIFFQMNHVYDQVHGKNRHVNTEWRHLLVTREHYSIPFPNEVQRIVGVQVLNLNFLQTKKATEVLLPAVGELIPICGLWFGFRYSTQSISLEISNVILINVIIDVKSSLKLFRCKSRQSYRCFGFPILGLIYKYQPSYMPLNVFNNIYFYFT